MILGQKLKLFTLFVTVGISLSVGIVFKTRHPSSALLFDLLAVVVGLGGQFLRMPIPNRMLLGVVTVVAALAGWVTAA